MYFNHIANTITQQIFHEVQSNLVEYTSLDFLEVRSLII